MQRISAIMPPPLESELKAKALELREALEDAIELHDLPLFIPISIYDY